MALRARRRQPALKRRLRLGKQLQATVAALYSSRQDVDIDERRRLERARG
jgi:hypothetical protein